MLPIFYQNREEDLSTNQEKWSLRPPGAAILPTFGMLLGLSLGQSIKLGLLFCSVTGGAGWLIVFKSSMSINILYLLQQFH